MQLLYGREYADDVIVVDVLPDNSTVVVIHLDDPNTYGFVNGKDPMNTKQLVAHLRDNKQDHDKFGYSRLCTCPDHPPKPLWNHIVDTVKNNPKFVMHQNDLHL